MVSEADEARYARGRAQVSNLLQKAAFRERVWAVFGVFGVLAGQYTSWSSANKVAAATVKAAKCDPLVLDEDGRLLHSAPLSELDHTKVDGIIVSRLFEAVACIRGLDPQPKAVARCWKRTTRLFVDDAAAALQRYQTQHFGTVAAIEKRLKEEHVEVTLKGWDKPDKALPNRYWLRWEEQHLSPAGQLIGEVETWSGTFDVDVVLPDGKSGDWNPVRVTHWTVQRDVVNQ